MELIGISCRENRYRNLNIPCHGSARSFAGDRHGVFVSRFQERVVSPRCLFHRPSVASTACDSTVATSAASALDMFPPDTTAETSQVIVVSNASADSGKGDSQCLNEFSITQAGAVGPCPEGRTLTDDGNRFVRWNDTIPEDCRTASSVYATTNTGFAADSSLHMPSRLSSQQNDNIYVFAAPDDAALAASTTSMVPKRGIADAGEVAKRKTDNGDVNCGQPRISISGFAVDPDVFSPTLECATVNDPTLLPILGVTPAKKVVSNSVTTLVPDGATASSGDRAVYALTVGHALSVTDAGCGRPMLAKEIPTSRLETWTVEQMLSRPSGEMLKAARNREMFGVDWDHGIGRLKAMILGGWNICRLLTLAKCDGRRIGTRITVLAGIPSGNRFWKRLMQSVALSKANSGLGGCSPVKNRVLTSWHDHATMDPYAHC